MAFSYITRGNSVPRGKSRVCFICCQEDYDHWFPVITEEIFATQNCVIWFCDQGDNSNVDFSDLVNMQLLVMPITSRLLSDDFIISECIPFAAENGIPILPIMVESGLDRVFNQKCGELEYLDKTSLDPTARPYEERLTRFLDSVLLNDAQLEEIKAAFDAYIFLSYRKKDRKYAQELMQLIHQNPFCEKVAIWYDEFLVPGENFNQAIETAIQKSSLFSLVVTPNLVNERNYVSEIEYPAAMAKGKTVLSFEMEKTEFSDLEKAFSGIASPIHRTETEKISESLREHLPEAGKTGNDAVHSFFVGLAYLSGIDVEVDKERAYRLISSAADGGLIPAMKKLVSMYSKGEGVSRDINAAVSWQQKVVRKLGDIAEDSYTEQDAMEFLKENLQLAEMTSSTEDFEGAAEACETSIRLATILSFGAIEKNPFQKIKSLFKKYVLNRSNLGENLGYLFKAYRFRLEIALKQGILEDIDEWSAKAPRFLETTKHIITEDIAGEIVRIAKTMCRQCIESGNLTAARLWLDNEERIRSEFSEDELTPKLRYSFSFMRDVAADYYEALERFDNAYICLENRRKSLNDLLAEFPDDTRIRFEIIKCIMHEARVCVGGGDLKFAKRLVEEARNKITEEQNYNNDNPETEFLKIGFWLLEGNILIKNAEYEQAGSLLREAFSALEPLLEKFYDAEHTREQGNISELIGDCFFAEEKYEAAYKWHYKAQDILTSVNMFSKQVKDSRQLARIYEKLLEDSLHMKEKTKIVEWNEKALWTRKLLVEGIELRSAGLRRSKAVNNMVEEGKIESPQYLKDRKALEALEARQESIMLLRKQLKIDEEKCLWRYVHLNETDKNEVQRQLFSRMAPLISDYLESHGAVTIRSDLEGLRKTLTSNVNNTIKDETTIFTIRKRSDAVQVYFLDHYRPFVRYDESSVLIMAFCGYIYLYFANRIKGGKEEAFEDYLRFFRDIVFWNYDVDELEYKETWCLLFQWIKESCPVTV